MFIPHWNNNDGGDELDTSRCFLGQARFQSMLEMLPKDQIVIGIDEHTALWMDCADQCFQVMGMGTITIIKDGEQRVLSRGGPFPLNDLVDCDIPDPTDGIPADVWKLAQDVAISGLKSDPVHPQEVLALSKERQLARYRKDWALADEYRDHIAALGWYVKDTPEGPVISKQ